LLYLQRQANDFAQVNNIFKCERLAVGFNPVKSPVNQTLANRTFLQRHWAVFTCLWSSYISHGYTPGWIYLQQANASRFSRAREAADYQNRALFH
jgi:hypothetical protein